VKVSHDIMDRAEWVDVHPDALEHESTLSADDLCDVRRVVDAMGRLSERQRDVLTRRVMGDTLVEVGAHLGRSRERTRQLEREAIWRTRDQLKMEPPTTARRSAMDVWTEHHAEQAAAWCARWASRG
jgi:DNA-directed RNA polymerase sigma subunit (sigma70/sigma32)